MCHPNANNNESLPDIIVLFTVAGWSNWDTEDFDNKPHRIRKTIYILFCFLHGYLTLQTEKKN